MPDAGGNFACGKTVKSGGKAFDLPETVFIGALRAVVRRGKMAEGSGNLQARQTAGLPPAARAASSSAAAYSGELTDWIRPQASSSEVRDGSV